MADRAPGQTRPGILLDFTINLPTVLTLVSMIGGYVAWADGQQTSYRKELSDMDSRVLVLQAQQEQTKIQLEELRRDSRNDLNQFRGEVREDLRDLKNKR